MKKLAIFLLVLSLSTKNLLKPESTEFAPSNEKSIPDRKKHDPATPVIVANFFNIVANGILAAHSEDDKKARQQAIAAALASVNNILQLAFKSLPLTPEEQEKIIAEVHKRIMRADVLDEIEILMATSDAIESCDAIE